MAGRQFAAAAHEREDALWSAVLQHPFVQGIGDGTLARDRYEFYLKQDYLYLIDYSRILAVAAAKGGDLAEMQRFSALLQLTLDMEMELHRRTCAAFGIGEEDLERTEPAMVTTAYTSTLLRACYEGRGGDLYAVLLPCAVGYVEIAEHLKAKGLPDNEHYRNWIATYTSEEMRELTDWFAEGMNRFAEHAGDADWHRWFDLYRTSARFELLFFQIAWEKSSWPACIPGF
jgi:thiaminase/transcriptional activator TenA